MLPQSRAHVVTRVDDEASKRSPEVWLHTPMHNSLWCVRYANAGAVNALDEEKIFCRSQVFGKPADLFPNLSPHQRREDGPRSDKRFIDLFGRNITVRDRRAFFEEGIGYRPPTSVNHGGFRFCVSRAVEL